MAWNKRAAKVISIIIIGYFSAGCSSNLDQTSGALSDGQAESRSRFKVGDQARVDPPRTPGPSARLRFRAQELSFQYDRGETGLAWPSETTGGGVALFDYDQDGRLDLFFPQGGPLRAAPGQQRPADVLLRNLGEGRFQDVSQAVGLTPKGYGQGVTLGDYDGDGDSDVYVTRYGRNTLWRNDKGRFTDATDQAGVGCPLWSLGAAFLDYDRDGDLDLFVANYFAFDPKLAPFSRDAATGAPRYGMPREFPGLPDVLYRNNGDGTFTDVTAEAGIKDQGRGMGCLTADFDDDGWIDILVANDAEPNVLWRNRHDGTFEDVAPSWGVAVNGEGQVEANMGVAYGDQNGDLLQDVIITHFFGEHDTLWRKEHSTAGGGGIIFEDRTRDCGLALDTLATTGWGVALEDFDQDGNLDLIITNGHIRPEPSQRFPYENPPLLWRGGGQEQGNRFINISATGGPYFEKTHHGRGLAAGDLDGDGDLDLVIVHHHAPGVVLWNETENHGKSLIIDLRGRGKNLDAVGARLRIQVGDRTMVRSVCGGGSYISSHDRRIHVGLAGAQQADRIEVRWPDGQLQVRENVKPGGVLLWPEQAEAESEREHPGQREIRPRARSEADSSPRAGG